MSERAPKPLDLFEPQFSQAELGEVTGLPMPTINNWIQSGAIRPADVGKIRMFRKPRLFSPIAIYEAVVTDVLVKLLNASPLTCAAIAKKTTDSQTWLHSVARNLESKKPRDYFQIVFWSDKCDDWDAWLEIPSNGALRIDLKAIAKETKEPRLSERPIFLLPVSTYLASVLKNCQAIINSTPHLQQLDPGNQ